MAVRILLAALDEDKEGQIILRGRIDPTSLGELRIAPYQREVLPRAKIAKLKVAFKDVKSSVPDLDLGMRGANFTTEKARGGDEAFLLHDPVFIIDGQQRTTAAKELLLEGFGARLGATVHFNTTEEWERERFRVLNVERSRLSPNVLLRNMQEDHAVVDTLYKLSFDSTFVLNRRVCWDQRQRREHLLGALLFLKTVARLHSHLGPVKATALEELVPNLQKLMEDKVGRNTMRDNIRVFFDVIDQAWGIRNVAFAEGAIHLRATFLSTLATVMSDHINFWRDNRLSVEPDYIARLKTFPVTDPTVIALASSTGQSWITLKAHFVEHLNHGKRERRLRPRVAA